MNKNQKNVLIFALALFFASIIYVPEMYVYNGNASHSGWVFLWDLSEDINLKILIVEWLGIFVIGLGIFLLFKSPTQE
jgi:uncharacterized membrane protein